MARAVLLSALVIALAGCGGSSVQGGPFTEADSDRAEAESNLRAAIPAMEAWFADNGTYKAATAAKLRSVYDSGIPDSVTVVQANGHTYCVESVVGSAAAHKEGPAADITTGRC